VEDETLFADTNDVSLVQWARIDLRAIDVDAVTAAGVLETRCALVHHHARVLSGDETVVQNDLALLPATEERNAHRKLEKPPAVV
jgi:hypothetical protein